MMSTFRLLLASLAYHWRMHAAVGLGVAAGTAVLTGALLVGDSMRGSLRHLTLDRLGRIDQALVVERFFRSQLAAELAAQPGFPKQSAAAPAILLQVSLESAGSGPAARANRVHLVGCDARFWQLGPKKGTVPLSKGTVPFFGHGGPPELPQDRQIVLNQPVAEELGVKVGDAVVVRLPHPGPIPADTPLGRKSETIRSQRLTVSQIIPAEGLGRFSLRPDQQAPRNAYVPLDWLQERLDQAGRVNAILVADAADSVQGLLHPRLDDYGIHLRPTRRGYANLTSDRMLLEPAIDRAAMRDLAVWHPQPAFTYLANTIACGKREIPYSTITAVDFAEKLPLGPMLTPDGKPVQPLGDGQIAVNTWAAEDLGARPGDTIRVTYFEPESTGGTVRERSVELRLAAVVQLAGAAADPDFTPEVPGVTDQLSMANWNPPFPFDARRVRKKDDAYWHDHRGTPKAFVALATGRRLWASRFGQTTSIRIPAADPAAIEQIRAALRIDPADVGFRFQPVKAQGLAASAGTTPFELLFLGFSFFLIVAAAMLVAILFRLGVDRRAAEIGILLAVGLRRGHVARLLVAEGSVVAALGSLVGLGAGIGYAALLIAGLHTWWLAAVVTPFLQLYVSWRSLDTWQSLGIGYTAGLVVALATIAWSARRAGRNRPRRLLAGQTGPEEIRQVVWHCLTAAGERFPRWLTWCPAAVKQWHTRRTMQAYLAWGVLAAAIGLAAAATRLDEELQAASFFSAASLVLIACLMFVWVRLKSGATGPAVAIGRGNLLRLAVRNAARNPMRSTLTIGLVAAASFVIVAVSAFRIDPAGEKPNLASGNGGFALVGQSDQPVYYDLNSPDGRAQLGFSADDERALAGVRTIPIRVLAGDDASCLNLYRPQQPRILGVPRRFIERDGFTWAAVASPADINSRGGASPVENPWRPLELDLAPDQDGVPRVPVVLEKTTADYSLRLGKGIGATYDVRDGSGRPLRLVVVGLLGPSIFQGDLLISETAFLRHFPEESGYRLFLIETRPEQAADVPKVARVLERTLGDYGLVAETTGQRLAAFQAVENTYLSTFQSLGGLGLLLGTFGLAAVQLRSVLERRGELALLRATGFRRRLLASMVILENAMLLVAGLGCGVLSAAVSVLPHFTSGRASIPWASLAGTLGLVLAAGLLAGLAAVRSALRAPLVAALGGE